MSRWSIRRERPLLPQAHPATDAITTPVHAPRTEQVTAPVTGQQSPGRHAAAPVSCACPRAWEWILRRLRCPQPGRRHRAGALRRSRLGAPGAQRSLRIAGVPLALVPFAGQFAFGPPMAVADLPTVIGNATTWLVGILATLATFFLTLGGARYLSAGGDPAEVEKAKTALKSAGIGYGLALLAPVILTVLQQILGTGK